MAETQAQRQVSMLAALAQPARLQILDRVADAGPEGVAAGAIARILELAPDLVICTGDMVAGQQASPKLTEPQLMAMWSAFHATVTDPLKAAGIPLLVTPGNHDASAYPGFELERKVFDTTWTKRAPEIESLAAAARSTRTDRATAARAPCLTAARPRSGAVRRDVERHVRSD